MRALGALAQQVAHAHREEHAVERPARARTFLSRPQEALPGALVFRLVAFLRGVAAGGVDQHGFVGEPPVAVARAADAADARRGRTSRPAGTLRPGLTSAVVLPAPGAPMKHIPGQVVEVAAARDREPVAPAGLLAGRVQPHLLERGHGFAEAGIEDLLLAVDAGHRYPTAARRLSRGRRSGCWLARRARQRRQRRVRAPSSTIADRRCAREGSLSSGAARRSSPADRSTRSAWPTTISASSVSSTEVEDDAEDFLDHFIANRRGRSDPFGFGQQHDFDAAVARSGWQGVIGGDLARRTSALPSERACAPGSTSVESAPFTASARAADRYQLEDDLAQRNGIGAGSSGVAGDQRLAARPQPAHGRCSCLPAATAASDRRCPSREELPRSAHRAVGGRLRRSR